MNLTLDTTTSSDIVYSKLKSDKYFDLYDDDLCQDEIEDMRYEALKAKGYYDLPGPYKNREEYLQAEVDFWRDRHREAEYDVKSYQKRIAFLEASADIKYKGMYDSQVWMLAKVQDQLKLLQSSTTLTKQNDDATIKSQKEMIQQLQAQLLTLTDDVTARERGQAIKCMEMVLPLLQPHMTT